MNKSKLKRLAAVGLFLLVCGAGIGYWRHQLCATEIGTHRFRVVANDTVKSVAERMERLGMVRSAASLLLDYRIFRPKGQLSVGTWEISTSKSAPEIMATLLQTKPMSQLVVIRPGLWASQLAELLGKKGVDAEKRFLDEMNNPSRYSAQLGFRAAGKSLEGYLFPDSYDLPPDMGAGDALRKICENFRRKALPTLAGKSPAEIHSILTLASLVEKEAEVDRERAKIAGVLMNRLRLGMRLQVDATVTYSLKTERRLHFKDYEAPSEYNTYLHAGLPPGPICSPGLASIKAAANPERNDFLYYTAKGDGTHWFAKTYAEHLQNTHRSKMKS